MSLKRKIFIIFLVVFAVYLNSLFNPFIWDDINLIVENPAIKSFNYFFHWFKSDLFGSEKIKFYRPLQSLVYSIVYHIAGLKPFAYHFLNIFLHSLNSILFYLLLREIFEEKVAFFSAILFGVHPLNTEAITYISGTADPLWVFFMLLFILNFYINRYFLSFLFLILSLLSKETALLSPFYLILFLWATNNMRRKNIPKILPVFLICMFYILLRIFIGSAFIYGKDIPFSYRFFTAFKSFLYYLKLIIFPDKLSMARSFHWIGYKNPAFISGFLLLLLSLYFSFYFRKKKIYLFPYFWFLINFISISNIFFPLNANFAEHFIYSGITGILIYYPLLLKKFFKKKFIFLISFLCILYGIRTIYRNYDWKNIEKFYLKSIDLSSYPVQLYHNLGFYYLEQGKNKKALFFLQKAIKLKPEDEKIKLNIAGVFMRMKKYKEAEKLYREILNSSPDNPEILNDLAICYAVKGEKYKAEKLLKKAIEISPDFTPAIENLKKLK